MIPRFCLFLENIMKVEGTLIRFENLPICLCTYKNNTLKISHS